MADGKPKPTFWDNGGDSVTAISTLLELQKQGQNITVEEFLHSRDDKTLEDSVKKLSDELHFVKRDIRDIPAEEAQRLLADCFTNKQPLFQCTPPLTGNDVMHLLQQNWAMFLDHSFGVVDENGKLRGVALACDGSEPDLKLQGVHPHLGAIVQYLHVISAQAAPQFIADPHIPGAVRSHFLMGTAIDNTPRENVYVMYLLEELSKADAIAKGFKMSLVQNGSPITQQLAEMLGWNRVLIDNPYKWTDANGHHPFRACSPEFTITVDLLYVRDQI